MNFLRDLFASDASDQATELLAQHDVHVIYKHSPLCSLSQMAADEVRVYRALPEALPITVLDVFADRALSNAIEQVTDIRHESPQVLLIRNGTVVWHASHRRVTAASITDAQRRLAHEASA